MAADPDIQALKRWLIVLMVFLVPVGSVASCNAFNRSGFCKQQMRWVSDEEKLALAITAQRYRNLTMDERLQIAQSFKLKHPDCCRIYRPSELIGKVREVEAGLVERPTYVHVEDGNPKNVIISSCADTWEPWDDVPLPPGSAIP